MRPIRFDVALDQEEAVEWLRSIGDDEAVDIGTLLGSLGGGAAQGASLGAAAGPYGALIGAAAGGLGSLAQSARRAPRPARPSPRPPTPTPASIASPMMPEVLSQVADFVAARVLAAIVPLLEKQAAAAAPPSPTVQSAPAVVEALSDDVPEEVSPACWRAGEDEPDDADGTRLRSSATEGDGSSVEVEEGH